MRKVSKRKPTRDARSDRIASLLQSIAKRTDGEMAESLALLDDLGRTLDSFDELHKEPLAGDPAGDDLAAVAAIHAKIGVRGENQRIGMGFRHPHEAGIGQAHRHIRVLLHELQDRFKVIGELEARNKRATLQDRAQGKAAARPKDMKSLRQRGLAGIPRRWKLARLPRSPCMMDVAPA